MSKYEARYYRPVIMYPIKVNLLLPRTSIGLSQKSL